MIDRQGGKVLISCDSCDSVFTGDDGAPFDEVWPEAKRAGWQARKVADEWLHLCEDPKCRRR